jgi:hypothetical protein
MSIDITIQATENGVFQAHGPLFENRTDAEAQLTTFPKSYGFKVEFIVLIGSRPATETTPAVEGVYGWAIAASAVMFSTEANEKNEAGVKRYRAITRKAASITWGSRFRGAMDRDAFEARYMV